MSTHIKKSCRVLYGGNKNIIIAGNVSNQSATRTLVSDFLNLLVEEFFVNGLNLTLMRPMNENRINYLLNNSNFYITSTGAVNINPYGGGRNIRMLTNNLSAFIDGPVGVSTVCINFDPNISPFRCSGEDICRCETRALSATAIPSFSSHPTSPYQSAFKPILFRIIKLPTQIDAFTNPIRTAGTVKSVNGTIPRLDAFLNTSIKQPMYGTWLPISIINSSLQRRGIFSTTDGQSRVNDSEFNSGGIFNPYTNNITRTDGSFTSLSKTIDITNYDKLNQTRLVDATFAGGVTRRVRVRNSYRKLLLEPRIHTASFPQPFLAATDSLINGSNILENTGVTGGQANIYIESNMGIHDGAYEALSDNIELYYCMRRDPNSIYIGDKFDFINPNQAGKSSSNIAVRVNVNIKTNKNSWFRSGNQYDDERRAYATLIGSASKAITA
jgi:hypothetical protein